MNTPGHLDSERLLHYADGGDLTADEARHLTGCEPCQQHLAELGAFEAAVAAHTPIPPAARERVATLTRQVLARGAGRHRGRITVLAAAAAAALLLVGWLWWSDPAALPVLVRERPDPTRADVVERLHVECELPAGSWPLLWAEFADGSLQPLLPHADPLLGHLGAEPPLSAGRHRLPASALFDFEFAATALPQALLLAASSGPSSEADRATLAAELRAAPSATRTDLLQRSMLRAWRLPVEQR